MQLRINKFSHNIKTILIAILAIPILLLTMVTTLDQDVLKIVGIEGAKASNTYLPENTVFTISNKNGLALTANGFRTGEHPFLYAKNLNSKDINQHFVWKRNPTNPERGYLFINGTSKVLDTAGLTYNLYISDYRTSKAEVALGKGPFQNSIQLFAGFIKAIGIRPDGKDKIIELESTNTDESNQYLFAKPVSGVKAKIDDDVTSDILKEGTNFSLSTYSGLTFTVPGIIDNKTLDIIAQPINGKSTQKLSWKKDSTRWTTDSQIGYLIVNNSDKAINADSYNIQLVDLTIANPFLIRKGFALNSYQLKSGLAYHVNISKSGAQSSKGSIIGTYINDLHDLDQTFYTKLPNQNPIFKPGTGSTPPRVITNNPSTTTTSNQPLIPSGYIFTMAAKHGWGVDGNKYKTSKTKRAFAYPRDKTDPEQVIKWEPAGSKNTGYLRLNGTDLTWTNKGGFLTLEKYKGTESQRWDVKEIDGVNDAYHLVDRSTKKVITINAETGYDVHVESIKSGDERQYMVVNKIK
jgi:hypothetical protein